MNGLLRNAVELARSHNRAVVSAARWANACPKGSKAEKHFRALEREARKLLRSAMACARTLRDHRDVRFGGPL